MKHKTSCIALLFVLLSAVLFQPPCPPEAEAAQRVRLAVYDNPPIIFQDASGRLQGLFADVLSAVAEKEGWTVEPVPGTFLEGLKRLENKEVDLMAGVAVTPEREHLYSFNRETVLSNYGIFYQSTGSRFDSFLDLDRKRVALVRGDIYARSFWNLASRFGIGFEAVEVDDYPDVFRALESGKAQAGLVSRSYGQASQGRFRVERSPIVIAPVELRFAAPLGRSAVLLQVLDFHLGQMKTREDSPWLRSMARWIEGGSGSDRLPQWFCTSSWVIGFLLVVFLSAAFIFRKQALRLARQLMKSQKALSAQKNYLENLFQNSPDAIAFLDAQGQVLQVNRPFLELFGFPAEECRGRHLDDLIVPEDRKQEASRITEKARSGMPTSLETVRQAKDGTRIDVHVQGVPVFSEGCKIGEYFLYRDIRERRAAERALLANREDLKRSLQRMDRAWKQTVEVLSATAEARDPYTAGHQRRVAHLAGAIAREMGQGERFVEGVVLASLVHDIGKIVIPSELLSKPGRLTSMEFDLFRVHPGAGASILESIDLPWPLAQIVRQHHERLDGSGYPNGLSGEAILPEARILAVADVVEAMASHRPYRPALGIGRALEELEAAKGALFDRHAVDACLFLFREKKFAFLDPVETRSPWVQTL